MALLDVVRVGLERPVVGDLLRAGRAGPPGLWAVEPRRLVDGQRSAIDQQAVRLLVAWLVVKAQGDPSSIAGAVRQEIRRVPRLIQPRLHPCG